MNPIEVIFSGLAYSFSLESLKMCLIFCTHLLETESAQTYLRAIYISYHITRDHTRNCFLMTGRRLKNVRGSITLKPYSQGYLYSFLKAKHNLSVKTQFLRRVLSNFHHLYCRAVLRSYSFHIPLQKG